jgi:tetratricopeptide (TPR) repeat protein
VAKALCYKQLGKIDKAIALMEQYMQDTTLKISVFDHLHLGVMYLEKGDYNKAIDQFNLQNTQSALAENQYYLALCHQKMGNTTLFSDHMTISQRNVSTKSEDGIPLYRAPRPCIS